MTCLRNYEDTAEGSVEREQQGTAGVMGKVMQSLEEPVGPLIFSRDRGQAAGGF